MELSNPSHSPHLGVLLTCHSAAQLTLSTPSADSGDPRCKEEVLLICPSHRPLWGRCPAAGLYPGPGGASDSIEVGDPVR